MKNQGLGNKRTTGSIIRFAFPTIMMMVFNAFYMIVDGMFIARVIDEVAISAVNIFYPILGLMVALSLMISTGGNALLSKKLGQGKKQEARENLSFLMIAGVVLGMILTILGLLFFNPILYFLGAGESSQLFAYTASYTRLFILCAPIIILRMLCLSFFIVSGSPRLGLITSVAGGIANIFLDYFFLVVLGMGIKGAAIATVIGLSIPAVVGIPYFFIPGKKELYFVKPVLEWHVLIESCINGMSEMVANLASAITAFAYNQLMLRYVGIEGVTAITIFFYIFFLFADGFVGYANGISSLIGFSYGSEDYRQLQKLFRVSMKVISISGVGMFLLSIIVGPYFIAFMTESGSDVFSLTVNGMRISSVSFLLMGFNIFASFLFTSLSNGKISAILSFLRTLGFILLALLILPPLLGVVGIWLAIPIAESMSLVVSFYFAKKYRSTYHYM